MDALSVSFLPGMTGCGVTHRTSVQICNGSGDVRSEGKPQSPGEGASGDDVLAQVAAGNKLGDDATASAHMLVAQSAMQTCPFLTRSSMESD